MIKLKYLRKGDFFTRKNILYPNEKQVFIRGDYDHSEKNMNAQDTATLATGSC